MTIETTKKIIAELRNENDPKNNELINFYERKINEVVKNAIVKAFETAFIK